LPAKDHGVEEEHHVFRSKESFFCISVAPCRQKSTSSGRERLAAASLLATMARKEKLQVSNHKPHTTPTEKTRSSASIQKQHTTHPLLLATKAGQERCRSAPCSTKKSPHLATMAGLGSFVFTAEGGRRTSRRSFIEEEDGAATRRTSLRPPEER
jgi:hypothetical protein